jgi:hypothetical protein
MPRRNRQSQAPKNKQRKSAQWLGYLEKYQWRSTFDSRSFVSSSIIAWQIACVFVRVAASLSSACVASFVRIGRTNAQPSDFLALCHAACLFIKSTLAASPLWLAMG